MKNLLLLCCFLFFIHTKSYTQCYSDQSPAFWKISEDYGSKLLSACDDDAYYNCHGFVISYFENGCTDPSWFNYMPIPAPYECPNAVGRVDKEDYSTSKKFVQVCNETQCDIVYYHTVAGTLGGHSAVKEIINPQTGDAKYLSKYSFDGPLVAHPIDSSYYHLHTPILIDNTMPYEYWVYIGKIEGDNGFIEDNKDTITSINPVSYKVQNKPGVNYSWSITGGYSNIYVSSGANQNEVTLVPTHSGTAVLKLITGSSCTVNKTQLINLTIHTNVCLEGSYSNNGNTYNLNTVNSVSPGGVSVSVSCPNATTYTWQKTSGNINGWFPPGNSIAFTMTSGGSISFLVTAKNGSSTLATRNVTFYNYGSYMVYPNPATTSLKVDLNEDLPFTLTLSKLDNKIVYNIENYSGKDAINTSGMEGGDYSLKIYYKGKLLNQQHVFISK